MTEIPIDTSIDVSSAKFFCLFSDKKLIDYFQQIQDLNKIEKAAAKINQTRVKLAGAVNEASLNISGKTIARLSQDEGAIYIGTIMKQIHGKNNTFIKKSSPWLIGGAVILLGAVLWPSVRGAYRRMFRTVISEKNSLAFVRFKDTAGKSWQLSFSGDNFLWKLSDASTKSNFPRKYTATFIQTSFATQFIQRCQQFIPITLDNPININILYRQQTGDPNFKAVLEEIVKSKKVLYKNMFSGKC